PQFRHLFRGEIHIELNEPASLRFHEQDHETLAGWSFNDPVKRRCLGPGALVWKIAYAGAA
ncbi:hypothetical protein, partial [Streptomyces mirabilis]|uniref:hypothetical protein n=1 Tax=Streptomyces mirabilis TaxID=68239 RepID=UPI0033B7FB48